MQDAEPINLSPTVELCDSPIEPLGLNLSKIGDIDLEETIRTTLERLYPVEAVYGGYTDRSDAYDAIMHAQICRFAVLGLSTSTIARAVGITPATLGRWLQKYPKLNSDIYRAQSASVTDAVLRLRKMMGGDDPTALKAIIFFLQSRSPDFAEKTRLEVSTVDEKTLGQDIRREIYGIREDATITPLLPTPSDREIEIPENTEKNEIPPEDHGPKEGHPTPIRL